MKNQIIIIIVLLGGSLFVSAQKNAWTIGLHTGVQGQIFTSVKQEYHRAFYKGEGAEEIINRWGSPQAIIKHTLSHIPPVELTVKYNIGNRFSIATGVGYRSYYMKIKDNPFYDFTRRDDYIQIPIIFQYDIPLKKKGFSFFVQGGAAIDIEINSTDWKSYSNEYYDRMSDKLLSVENSTTSYFSNGGNNFLLHAGIGFSYKFSSGIGISLLGRYNIGMMYVSIESYHTMLKEMNTGNVEREIKEKLYGRAECWNVLLGVSYSFKNKKKE